MLTKAFRVSGSYLQVKRQLKWVHFQQPPPLLCPSTCIWVNISFSVPANFSTVHLSFVVDTSWAKGTFLFLPLHLSIHPSIRLKPNWRPVSACNFFHDHTFVFVSVMKHCSSPWPPCRSVFVVKNVLRLSVEIWRSERDKTCVCRVRERETLLPFYLGHIHLSGWLASLSV